MKEIIENRLDTDSIKDISRNITYRVTNHGHSMEYQYFNEQITGNNFKTRNDYVSYVAWLCYIKYLGIRLFESNDFPSEALESKFRIIKDTLEDVICEYFNNNIRPFGYIMREKYLEDGNSLLTDDISNLSYGIIDGYMLSKGYQISNFSSVAKGKSEKEVLKVQLDRIIMKYQNEMSSKRAYVKKSLPIK